MKCPYCKEWKGNNKVRGYPVSEQLRRHIRVDHCLGVIKVGGDSFRCKLTPYHGEHCQFS